MMNKTYLFSSLKITALVLALATGLWAAPQSSNSLAFLSSTVSLDAGLADTGEWLPEIATPEELPPAPTEVTLLPVLDQPVLPSESPVIDQTAPVSQLLLLGETSQDVPEALLLINQLTRVTGSEHDVIPFGTQMTKISNHELTLVGDANFISFAYNFGSDLTNAARLKVTRDGEEIYQQLAADAPIGWQVLTIDVRTAKDKQVTLVVEDGLGATNPGYLYLDHLNLHQSTSETALNFRLEDEANDPTTQLHYQFTRQGQVMTNSASGSYTFSLTGPLDTNAFTYWSSDAAGNHEEARQFNVHFHSLVQGATEGGEGATASESAETSVALTFDPVTNKLRVELDNAEAYTEYDYEAVYSHLVEGQAVQEALVGQHTIEGSELPTTVVLYLGTCSEQGLVCVPHLNPTQIEIKVILKGPGLPERTLTATVTEKTTE